jgi:hypothetical protein
MGRIAWVNDRDHPVEPRPSPLDDEELAASRIGELAVGELARQ